MQRQRQNLHECGSTSHHDSCSVSTNGSSAEQDVLSHQLQPTLAPPHGANAFLQLSGHSCQCLSQWMVQHLLLDGAQGSTRVPFAQVKATRTCWWQQDQMPSDPSDESVSNSSILFKIACWHTQRCAMLNKSAKIRKFSNILFEFQVPKME